MGLLYLLLLLGCGVYDEMLDELVNVDAHVGDPEERVLFGQMVMAGGGWHWLKKKIMSWKLLGSIGLLGIP